MVEAMWSRRMMLTPCAVSTFATLPRKMICRDNASGSYRTEYLFNRRCHFNFRPGGPREFGLTD